MDPITGKGVLLDTEGRKKQKKFFWVKGLNASQVYKQNTGICMHKKNAEEIS